MNKNQKITLIIMLLIMAVILIYPPTEYGIGNSNFSSRGRELVFSIGGSYRINMRSMLVQLSAVILIGGALIIGFGLKKED